MAPYSGRDILFTYDVEYYFLWLELCNSFQYFDSNIIALCFSLHPIGLEVNFTIELLNILKFMEDWTDYYNTSVSQLLTDLV